jgi:DNA-directed RNA polymerase specialized sigma24 family protein
VVTDLVTCARKGDKQAWDALVERHSPLIWSICRRHRLRDADAEDVGQSVWLHLVDQLDKIRDPATLPGWLFPVTQDEHEDDAQDEHVEPDTPGAGSAVRAHGGAAVLTVAR